MEACVWRCLKLSVKLWLVEHAMLRGRLGLLATRQEMMQVWIVTWIPEAQTGIRLDWGRGETRRPRCCRTHQIRAEKKWEVVCLSGQVLQGFGACLQAPVL